MIQTFLGVQICFMVVRKASLPLISHPQLNEILKIPHYFLEYSYQSILVNNSNICLTVDLEEINSK